ncbi:MAG: helix-turn-helix transcriptional regulator [Actinomycetota bacterium]|nr:helix-turn-helix transcriptional regulator [Actinomycetota bacterium]
MRDRAYGQFCGLARAAEVLGQRWTILVLRDLLVAPRRYSELLQGLPGIPTNGLASRLKELEDDGLVVRIIGAAPDRFVVYQATERAQELTPALDALARWGAAGMHQPRAGEVVTDASLVSALRSAVRPRTTSKPRSAIYEVRIGDATAHAIVGRKAVAVNPGGHPASDLTLEAGPRFRDVLAGELNPDVAATQDVVRLHGDRTLFKEFVSTFHVPYSAHLRPTSRG